MKKRLLPAMLIALMGMIVTGCGDETVDEPKQEQKQDDPEQKQDDPEPIVYATSITNKEALTADWYVVDGSRTVSVTASPGVLKDLKADGKITLASSASDIVKVEDFTIYPMKTGKATLTVTYGTATDTVEVEVKGEEHPYTATKIATAVNAALAKKNESTTADRIVGPYDIKGVVTEVIGKNGYYLAEEGVGVYIYKTFPSNLSGTETIQVGQTIHWHGYLYTYNGLVETYYNSKEQYAQTCYLIREAAPVTVTAKEYANIAAIPETAMGTRVTVKGLYGDGYTAPFETGKTRVTSIYGDEGATITLNYHIDETLPSTVSAAISAKMDKIENEAYSFDLVNVNASIANSKWSFEVTSADQIVLHELTGENLVNPASITFEEVQDTSMAPGSSLKLVANLAASDNTKRVNCRGLVWSSSDETVATVDQFGTVTALNKSGPVKITAKSKANDTIKAEIDLTVAPIDQDKTEITSAKLVGYTGEDVGYVNEEQTKFVNGDGFVFYQISAYKATNGALQTRKADSSANPARAYPSYIRSKELKAPIKSVEIKFNAVKQGTFAELDYLKVIFGVDEAFTEATSESHLLSFDADENVRKVSPSDVSKYKYVKFEHASTYGAYYDYITINYTGDAYAYPFATDGSAADKAYSVKDAREYLIENKNARVEKFVKGVVSSATSTDGVYQITLKDGNKYFDIKGAVKDTSLTKEIYVGDEIIAKGTTKRDSSNFMLTPSDADTPVKPTIVTINTGKSSVTKAESNENCTVTITNDVSQPLDNGTVINFTVAAAEGFNIESVKVYGKALTGTSGAYSFTLGGDAVIAVETKDANAAPVVSFGPSEVGSSYTNENTVAKTNKSFSYFGVIKGSQSGSDFLQFRGKNEYGRSAIFNTVALSNDITSIEVIACAAKNQNVTYLNSNIKVFVAATADFANAVTLTGVVGTTSITYAVSGSYKYVKVENQTSSSAGFACYITSIEITLAK